MFHFRCRKTSIKWRGVPIIGGNRKFWISATLKWKVFTKRSFVYDNSLIQILFLIPGPNCISMNRKNCRRVEVVVSPLKYLYAKTFHTNTPIFRTHCFNPISKVFVFYKFIPENIKDLNVQGIDEVRIFWIISESWVTVFCKLHYKSDIVNCIVAANPNGTFQAAD